MRIIAGAAKGRRLQTRGGRHTRPTSGRVRQVLFDLLSSRIEGSRFLDLFAGSGAVGLEALSRGAAQVTLVESDHSALEHLRANLAALSGPSPGQGSVVASPAMRAIGLAAQRGEAYNIVFLDPPYDLPEALLSALERLGQGDGAVAPQGLVVAQHQAKVGLPDRVGDLRAVDVRKLGDTVLRFYLREDG
jgi:16S rRNA (guanine966-N2)-methyltransferase